MANRYFRPSSREEATSAHELRKRMGKLLGIDDAEVKKALEQENYVLFRARRDGDAQTWWVYYKVFQRDEPPLPVRMLDAPAAKPWGIPPPKHEGDGVSPKLLRFIRRRLAPAKSADATKVVDIKDAILEELGDMVQTLQAAGFRKDQTLSGLMERAGLESKSTGRKQVVFLKWPNGRVQPAALLPKDAQRPDDTPQPPLP